MTAMAFAPVPVDQLTARELLVLRCASYGLSNEETGFRCGVSEGTIKWHRTNLIRKLEARNITHAVAIGYAEGWLR